MSLEEAGRELTMVDEGLEKLRTHVVTAEDAFARTHEKIEAIKRELETTILPLLKDAEARLGTSFETMEGVFEWDYSGVCGGMVLAEVSNEAYNPNAEIDSLAMQSIGAALYFIADEPPAHMAKLKGSVRRLAGWALGYYSQMAEATYRPESMPLQPVIEGIDAARTGITTYRDEKGK